MMNPLPRRTAARIPLALALVFASAAHAQTTASLGDTQARLLARLQDLLAGVPLLGIALVALILFWLLSKWLGRTDLGFSHIKNPLLRGLVRQIIQSATLIVGVLVALEIMNAMALAGAVLGTAGIVGLAVGFALKDVVENYLAGILLSMRQPFAANDLVELEGFTGKVVRLTSRATILMTLDGNHVRIPNAVVFKIPMTNYTRNPLRRFDFTVGVGSGEDLLGAQQLGIETLGAIPGILADPEPTAMLEPPGDSSIGVHFFAWVDQNNTSLGKAKSAAIRRVTQALDEAGIDMPEPIYRVDLGGPQLTVTESEAADTPQGDTADSRRADAVSIAHDPEIEDTSAEHDIDEQIQRDRRAPGQSGLDLLRSDAQLE